MVAVLVAVLVMAASIWIAIFLEPRLGMLPTRATLARVSQPASCRFRHGAGRPAVRRPVRCTQGVRAEVVDLRERGQLFRAMGDPQQRPVARAPAPPGAPASAVAASRCLVGSSRGSTGGRPARPGPR